MDSLKGVVTLSERAKPRDLNRILTAVLLFTIKALDSGNKFGCTHTPHSFIKDPSSTDVNFFLCTL